jgi:hypothetical protein
MSKFLELAISILPLLFVAVPGSAATDPRIANLALCRDSWMDWERSDRSTLDDFGNFLRTNFSRDEDSRGSRQTRQ